MMKAFRILLALFLLAGCVAGPQGTKGGAGPSEPGTSPIPTGEPSLDTPPVAFPGEVENPKAPTYPSGTCWGLSISPKNVCREEMDIVATAIRSVWEPAERVTIEVFTQTDKEEQIGGEPVVLVADEDPEAHGVQTKADDSGGISFGIVRGDAEGVFFVRVSGSSSRGRICGHMNVCVNPWLTYTEPRVEIPSRVEGAIVPLHPIPDIAIPRGTEDEDEDTTGESLIPEGTYFFADPEVQILQWVLPPKSPPSRTKKGSLRR